MKKASLIIFLLLLSCHSFCQTLKTTIDNSILGQGTRGISAVKLRNVFTILADSVSSKPNQNYTDSRYVRQNGNVLTGNITLYNSVRVGGTSSFGGNTFLGKNAFVSWTSGSNNTAIGDGSLSTLTTSNYNTGIGKDALKTNNGSSNTSVGGNSMYSNTTGGYNVAIGISALTNNTTGNYNVAIGPYSGQYNSGTGNVFLGGYNANSERTRQNSMFLGNGSGSLHIFGDSLNNVGIGTTRPVSKLQVDYENVISYSSNIPNGYGNLHLLPTGTNGSSTGISFGANTGYGNYTSVVNAGIHVQSSYLYGTKMRFSTSNNLTTGAMSRMIIDQSGNVGINNEAPTSKLHVTGLAVYTDNSAAILGGLTAGAFYRTSAGVVMVVY